MIHRLFHPMRRPVLTQRVRQLRPITNARTSLEEHFKVGEAFFKLQVRRALALL
jgi:hypothetical protein